MENTRISAVICEFNPLHNGHAQLLQRMRENGTTHIVALMSGNFTQRGEPAAFDKMVRARAAIACGADLVAELPVSFACAGAERFARGGVLLSDSFGCIDELCFGSECGDIDLLNAAADAVSSPALGTSLKTNLDSGMTFAAARQRAVHELFGEKCACVLSDPNDILATEYIKAIRSAGSNIKPIAFLRQGAAHDSSIISGSITSAKNIRCMISNSEDYSRFIPDAAKEIYYGAKCFSGSGKAFSRLETSALYRLKTMSNDEIACLPDVSEGLENRFADAAIKASTLPELIDLIKTKRYTRSRICRIIMSAVLGITKDSLSERPEYIRVLCARKGGYEILRMAKGKSTLPVLSRKADVRSLDLSGKAAFELEERADMLYSYFNS